MNAESQDSYITPRLHLLAWEITQRCNLFCSHCRASSTNVDYPDELSTQECFRVVDQVLEVARPMIILSGGEPLMRPDIFQIARYAVAKNLKVVMGTNGTLITPDVAAKLASVPISRLAISLDFPSPELQDNFRGRQGAFDAAIAGLTNAKRAGIEIQINSTITGLNATYLEELLDLALKAEAVAFHPFMLVPTGRGKSLESVELTPNQYEAILNWIYERKVEIGDRISFKPTDAPHYMRIVSQRENQKHLVGFESAPKQHPSMHAMTRGCLAGTGFCFISSRGDVKGCGYLDIVAGNIKRRPFGQIWNDAPLFSNLRNISLIKGKCGICEFKKVCGGCRARAYEKTGDYLQAEPYCVYEPRGVLNEGKKHGSGYHK